MIGLETDPLFSRNCNLIKIKVIYFARPLPNLLVLQNLFENTSLRI